MGIQLRLGAFGLAFVLLLGVLAVTVSAQATSAPQNLTATPASSSQINLAWNAPATGTASSYRIYRGTSPGTETCGFAPGDFPCFVSFTSSFQDKDLHASTTYYYKVSAENSGGFESALSNEASATTVAIGPPQSLTATPVSSSQINLAWNAPAIGTVSYYHIYRSTSPGSETCSNGGDFACYISNSLSFQDTGLPPGVTYYYKVSAHTTSDPNAGSESPLSNEATATTIPIGPPQSLTATPVSVSQINLAWSAPSSGTVSRYDIYRGTTPGGESFWGNAFGLTYSSTDLQASTTYYYYVRAVTNAGYQSVPSNEASATTMAIGPPQSLTATAVGISQINLAWNAPSGGGAAFYNVYRGTSSGAEVFIAQPHSLTFQDTGLQSGTTYYYQVRAVTSAISEGPNSNEASATTQTAVYHPYDANHDCIIQFPEYTATRSSLLNNGGATFPQYTQSRSALLQGTPYDQMFPEYNC